MSKTALLTSASVIIVSAAAHAHPGSNDLRDYSADTLARSSLEMWGENSKLDPSSIQALPQMLDPKEQVPDLKSLQDSLLTASTVLMEAGQEEDGQNIITAPSLAGFTIDQAVAYAELAELAYTDVGSPTDNTLETIEKLQAEGNRVQFFGTEAENSGLIITHKDGRVSVVYKGTDSLRNLATDVWGNLAIDDQTGLRCHNGIMKGFYRTKDQVFAILEQIAEARGKTMAKFLDEDVTATGHSLGGGLSQMFIGHVLKTYNVATKAITFATPRVFDIATVEAMEKMFEDKYLNVMQVTDPIPGIALGSLGYKHWGEKLHLPYAKKHIQHTMGGYSKALTALTYGPIEVGKTTFAYEKSKRTGVGNSKWVGKTYIPNPLYPLHALRESMARHVDPLAHKAVKTVKDTVIDVVTHVRATAKKALRSFWK